MKKKKRIQMHFFYKKKLKFKQKKISLEKKIYVFFSLYIYIDLLLHWINPHFLGYGGERTLLEKEQWSPLSTALVGREAFPSMLFYYYYYFVKSYISLSLIRIIILMFNGINVFYMFISLSLIRIIYYYYYYY